MKHWLRTTGRDGRQHVIYLPERRQHIDTIRCECVWRVERGVIVHEVLSAASRKQRGRV